MQIWDLLSVIQYIHDTYWKLDINMNKFQLLTALGVFMLFFGWSHGAHESGEMSSALIFYIKYECTCIDTSLAVQVPNKRMRRVIF